MEVTRKNFQQVYKTFEEKLKNADFVSIDGEFTGLSTLRGPRFSYDTLEEKYKKAKAGSDNFLIVQFGICLFTWSEENQCYTAFPFTFYIFPRPYKRFLNDVMFTCQSSSLDFLANHGFDFNKLFYDGISFMHPTTETKVNEKYKMALGIVLAKESAENSSHVEINHATLKPKDETNVFIPKDQREFIGTVVSTVEGFLQDTTQLQCDLVPCSPFQRKLIYEVIGEKYPMGLYLQSEINSEKKKFIRVIKVTNAASKAKSLEEQKQETDLYNEAFGFTNIIRLLSTSKKPLIGHNMFLDLFHSVTNFFSDAPDDLAEFKSLITTLFPLIFDTKLIASMQPLSSHAPHTGLQNLTECIGSGLPSIKLEIDQAVDNHDINEEDELKFHNAGFDALSTGKCFISLVTCLQSYSKLPTGRIDVSSKLIEPFKNCIFIMGIQDIRYMHLDKPDKQPSRRGVFLVNFPADWKETELHNLFSPICKLSHPIVWKDSTSAYISLSDKEKHDEVVSRLVDNQNHSTNFQVVPFKENCEPSVSNKRKRESVVSEVEEGEVLSTEEEEEPVKKTKKQEQLFEVSTQW